MDYDRKEARKYFAYDNVRDGILKLTEDMFGVDIRPWKTPTWDKLVEAYEMYDHGKLIGTLLFRLHIRVPANMSMPTPSRYAGRPRVYSGRCAGDEPAGRRRADGAW